MERTVWKYTLEWIDYEEIEMPMGAAVLHVGVQDGKLCLWCLVSPDAELVKRRFRIAGNDQISLRPPFVHLGTVVIGGGSLVFHIFEVPAVRRASYEE